MITVTSIVNIYKKFSLSNIHELWAYVETAKGRKWPIIKVQPMGYEDDNFYPIKLIISDNEGTINLSIDETKELAKLLLQSAEIAENLQKSS